MSAKRAPGPRPVRRPSSAGASAVRDVTGVITRRQRRRWLRRGLAIALTVLVLALVGIGVWIVGYSPYLALRDVEVVGNTTISVETVRGAAAAPIGQPLWRLDTKSIDDRVSTVAEVQAATVEKRYPHAVRIIVTERTPVYVSKTARGLRYIDAAGVDFRAAADPVPDGMVTAELPEPASQALRADVATVAAGLPAELKGGKITAQTRDSITIVLPDGRKVVWGGAEQTPLKAQVAVPLTKSVEASIYDVSSPGRPVTR